LSPVSSSNQFLFLIIQTFQLVHQVFHSSKSPLPYRVDFIMKIPPPTMFRPDLPLFFSYFFFNPPIKLVVFPCYLILIPFCSCCLDRAMRISFLPTPPLNTPFLLHCSLSPIVWFCDTERLISEMPHPIFDVDLSIPFCKRPTDSFSFGGPLLPNHKLSRTFSSTPPCLLNNMDLISPSHFPPF